MDTSKAHSLSTQKHLSKNNLSKNNLSKNNLSKNLFSYAAAASAAGVSLLALSKAAEAKVIYTPANIPIKVDSGLVQLDVNNDGVADFSFYNFSGTEGARKGEHARAPLGGFAAYLQVIPTQPANEVGAATSFTGAVCAAELGRGREISPNKNWKAGPLTMFAIAGDYTSPGSAVCPWRGKLGQSGYLPLRFEVAGNTYYGWARISALSGGPTITGYAYENVPNQGIKSGQTSGPDETSEASPMSTAPKFQPASLGALARGASDSAVWRRLEDTNQQR